jgi:hypothetical protein
MKIRVSTNNGKRELYALETAVKIANILDYTWDKTIECPFSYTAAIYKTKRSKKYFVYGTGGILSIFGLLKGSVARNVEMYGKRGEGLYPISEEMAFTLLRYECGGPENAYKEFAKKPEYISRFTEKELIEIKEAEEMEKENYD